MNAETLTPESLSCYLESAVPQMRPVRPAYGLLACGCDSIEVMCGRYALNVQAKILEEQFRAICRVELGPRYPLGKMGGSLSDQDWLHLSRP